MESYKPVDPERHDRNARIAEASAQQSRLNAKRALHYLGIDPVGNPEVYPTQTILDFIEQKNDSKDPPRP